MKLEEKKVAIALRKKGMSYSEILNHVNVSKGTLSIWLRDVPLSKMQMEELYVTRRQQNAYKLAKKRQKLRKNKTIIIQKNAMKELCSINNNPFFLTGIMLYWAEGDKSEDNELVKFSNSDPSMIILMMKWFRGICQVPNERFRIGIHIHELHNKKKIEQYWSQITGIPLTQFHKTQIKPTSLGHRKKMLYNGTCSIRISNKDLFRKIKTWFTHAHSYIDTTTKIV